MKIKLIMLVSLLALGFATNANAGAVTDSDTDLVPDAFDNCLTDSNGPNDGSNQVDADQDGYGNACDADYDNDIAHAVSVLDFGIFVGCLAPGDAGFDAVCDHDGVGGVQILDFSTFLRLLGPPSLTGPSGLSCAGNANVPCTP